MRTTVGWMAIALFLTMPQSARAGCFGGAPDGIVQAGETCDDGNMSNNDNCLNDCSRPFCGDGFTRTAGNCGGDATKPCATNAQCTPPATCTVEACDDGNLDNCDGCLNDCSGTVTGCGDGYVCGGEECDPPAGSGGAANCSSTCHIAVCGNGVHDVPQEQCDAGTALCTSGGAYNGRECGTASGRQACDADGGTCGAGNSDTVADACRTDCRNHRCGDGALDTGEVCDDGLAGATPAALDDLDNCPNGPTASSLGIACQVGNVCGDGLRLQVDSSARCVGACGGVLEGCDNGNGARKTCKSAPTHVCTTDNDCPLGDICGNSDTRSDACRTTCTPASCGDDVIDIRAGESCDDGRGVCTSGGTSNGHECTSAAGIAACSADGGTCADASGPDAGTSCSVPRACNSDVLANACRANCRGARCGDGVLDAGEECDDGPNNGVNRNCTDTCQLNVCGDGKRDTTPPRIEACDDGNTLDTDDCLNDCTLATCGDGKARTTQGACGGDTTKPCANDAGCVIQCTSGFCGGDMSKPCTTIANCNTPAIRCTFETCDDGNAVNGDGCDNNCKPTGCGNGIVTAGEECDDGNLVDGDGCDSNCRTTRCGNLVISSGEQCDDGNTADFDTCSSDCCLEPPNAPSKDAKFAAMDCFRRGLKRTLAGVAPPLPDHLARTMTTLIDGAMKKEARAKSAPSVTSCRHYLRSATRRIRSLQYRIDRAAADGLIPIMTDQHLGIEILLLNGWYQTIQSSTNCGS